MIIIIMMGTIEVKAVVEATTTTVMIEVGTKVREEAMEEVTMISPTK
jgi:hypothetical protein